MIRSDHDRLTSRPLRSLVETGLQIGLGILALAPFVVLAGLVGYLIWVSLPVFRYMRWGFFSHIAWNLGNLYANHPVWVHGVRVMPGAEFGALAFLLGTGLTSLMAICLAVPIAFFLASAASFGVSWPWRNILAILVEMMAGVPSVVFGLFGFVVLGPAIATHVGPWLNHWLSPIPFFSGPVTSETNLLTATVTLTLMVIPIVATTTRVAMDRVPRGRIDSARALGWTEPEVFWHVIWPHSRAALTGGTILGLGRALGETMAVLMVSGNALNVLPKNIYSGVSTMAATIAGQLDAVLTDPTRMAVHALGTLGLILLAISLAVNLIARLVVMRDGQTDRAGGRLAHGIL